MGIKQFSLAEFFGFVALLSMLAYVWSNSEIDGGLKLFLSISLAAFISTYVLRCRLAVGILIGWSTGHMILTVAALIGGKSPLRAALMPLAYLPAMSLAAIPAWWIARTVRRWKA